MLGFQTFVWGGGGAQWLQTSLPKHPCANSYWNQLVFPTPAGKDSRKGLPGPLTLPLALQSFTCEAKLTFVKASCGLTVLGQYLG